MNEDLNHSQEKKTLSCLEAVIFVSIQEVHYFVPSMRRLVLRSACLPAPAPTKSTSAHHQVEDDIISNREYHQPLITYSVIELPKPAVDQASEEENELHESTRSDDITTARDTACVQCLADQEL